MSPVDKRVLTQVGVVLLAVLGLGLFTWNHGQQLSRLSKDLTRISQIYNSFASASVEVDKARPLVRMVTNSQGRQGLSDCLGQLNLLFNSLQEASGSVQNPQVLATLAKAERSLKQVISALLQLAGAGAAGPSERDWREAAPALAQFAEIPEFILSCLRLETALLEQGSLEVSNTARTLIGVNSGALLGFMLLVLLLNWFIHQESTRALGIANSLRSKSEILQSVLHNMHDGVLAVDPEGHPIVSNPMARRSLGRRLRMLERGGPQEQWGIFHSDGSPIRHDELPHIRAARGQEIEEVELHLRDPHNGGALTLLASARPMHDNQHRLLGGIMVLRDVTRQRAAERDLKESNSKMNDLVIELEQRNIEVSALAGLMGAMQACVNDHELASASIPVLRTLFSTNSGQLYVIPPGSKMVKPLDGWNSSGKADALPFNPNDCWALRRGRGHYWQKGGDSPCCPHLKEAEMAESLCMPFMAHGEFLGLLQLNSDREGALGQQTRKLVRIAAEQLSLALGNLRLRELFNDLSLRDALTSLRNRRYFDQALDDGVAKASASKSSFGLLMLDIDHFKLFNDEYGHESGDDVLKAVSSNLAQRLGERGQLCRFGGEELAALIPGLGDAALDQLAEALRQSVASMRVQSHGRALRPVTVSIGVAAYPQDSADGHELLLHADEALYQAKSGGRNCCRRWTRELHDPSLSGGDHAVSNAL